MKLNASDKLCFYIFFKYDALLSLNCSILIISAFLDLFVWSISGFVVLIVDSAHKNADLL